MWQSFKDMIIYNVTVNIAPQIQDEWLLWMKEVHIPEVVGTGYFLSHDFFKIINTEDVSTYCIQYKCETIENYKKYQIEFAPLLQKKHTDKYKDQFVAFRTLLQKI